MTFTNCHTCRVIYPCHSSSVADANTAADDTSNARRPIENNPNLVCCFEPGLIP